MSCFLHTLFVLKLNQSKPHCIIDCSKPKEVSRTVLLTVPPQGIVHLMGPSVCNNVHLMDNLEVKCLLGYKFEQKFQPITA